MKSISLFLIFVLNMIIISNIFGQASISNNNITATCFTKDSNGNNYISGTFEGAVILGRHTIISKGNDDIFIAKYSSTGICLWATSAGGLESDYVSAIEVDETNNIFIVGRFGNNATFDLFTFSTTAINEMFIAKYNTSGDLIFIQKTQGEKNSDNSATSITISPNGECFVSASFSLPSKIGRDMLQGNLLLKFSSSLKYIGASKLGGEVASMKRDINGNIYLVGTFASEVELCKTPFKSIGMTDIFISKYNTIGNCIWTKQLGGINKDKVTDISIDYLGNAIVIGEFVDSMEISNHKIKSIGESDVFIAKYSPAGELLWLESGGSKSYDNISAIYIDNNNAEIFTTGKIGDEYAEFGNLVLGGIRNDVFITKSSTEGSFILGKVISNNNTCEGIGIKSDKKGDISVVGNFNTSINFEKKSLKTKGSGNSVFLLTLNSKFEFISLVNVGESDANFEFDPNAIYTNLKGKLFTGKELKKPLANQPVSLWESDGDFLQSTTTDIFGDFSFKNIDSKKSYNLDLGKNDNVPENEPIYLAKQTGEIIHSIFRNKDRDFKYEILPMDIQTLDLMNEEDHTSSIKSFIKDKNALEIIVTDNIYYEQDAYELPSEIKPKINEMIKTMRSNIYLFVEISSYTDSRGEDNYNLELSKKRATKVSDYFLSKGIPKERVVSNGYGETKILNRCSNNIDDCSEKEHYLNRRTEFKFTKRQ